MEFYNEKNLSLLVKKFAKFAKKNGLDGVVCSPKEIKIIRKETGRDFIIVTPGIRLKNRIKKDDQNIQIMMTKLYLFEAVEIILKKGKEIIPSISDKEKNKDLKQAIEKLCAYNIPNVIELKTKIADKIISENKYCF